MNASIWLTIITIDFAIKFTILDLILETLELRVYLKSNSNEHDFYPRKRKTSFYWMSLIRGEKKNRCYD